MKKIRNAKKRYITLIEIMIVMFLIALITGAVAFNLRGSLDEGKAFTTKTSIEKIENILNLRLSEDPNLAGSISHDWQDIIRNSPMVGNPNALLRDGWGQPFNVSADDRGVIRVQSQRYNEYVSTHQTLFGNPNQRSQ